MSTSPTHKQGGRKLIKERETNREEIPGRSSGGRVCCCLSRLRFLSGKKLHTGTFNETKN